MRSRSARSAALALAIATAACGSEGAPRPEGLVDPEATDSAGIHVVVNRVPSTGFPTYATVAPQPTVDITAGPQDGTLGRPVGAVTRSDRRVVVADAAVPALGMYGEDGALLATAGGPGFFVGSYQSLTRLGRFGGDSLWVADPRLLRITVLQPDASVQDTLHLPDDTGVAGRFADGTWLLQPGWSPAVRKAQGGAEVGRDTATWLRLSADGASVTRIGAFPHPQMVYVDSREGVAFGVPPFGRTTSVVVGPGRFYVGDQETFEIRGYDPDGTLREIVRLEGVPLELSPSEVAAARARRDTTRMQAWEERFWRAVPGTRPAYGRLLLDAAGNLWVGEYVSTLAPARNWLVFAPDGGALGLVEVPGGFEPLEIGTGHMLGTWTDADGQAHVRRHALTRGG